MLKRRERRAADRDCVADQSQRVRDEEAPGYGMESQWDYDPLRVDLFEVIGRNMFFNR